MSFLRAACQRLLDRPSSYSLRLVAVRWNQTTSGKVSQQAMQFKLGKPTKQQANVKKAHNINSRFSTPKAIAFSNMCMTSAAFVVFLAKIAPHSFQQENIQALYQHFSNGFPTTLASMTKAFISEVMEEMELTEKQVENIKFFVGCDSEAFSWGGIDTEFGLRVMLPNYLNYDRVGDVKISEYRFGSLLSSDVENKPHTLQQSELEKDEVKVFTQMLILSENAKKFLIARELERGKAKDYRAYSVVMPVAVLLTFLVSKRLNTVLQLFHRRPIYRPMNYTATASFFAICSIFVQDYLRRRNERKYDEAVCKLGKDYAKGGVEYYAKAIRKNQALRVIMPNESGKKLYNMKGEAYGGLFRKKYLKFQDRKEACEKFI